MNRMIMGALLMALAPAVSAQSLIDRIAQLGLEKGLAKKISSCLSYQPSVGRTDSGTRRTSTEWQCLLVGTMNRSQVIKFIGKPSRAMTGWLYYDQHVRDPDTGELYTLGVAFMNGEQHPATHVQYFSFPSAQPFPPAES